MEIMWEIECRSVAVGVLSLCGLWAVGDTWEMMCTSVAVGFLARVLVPTCFLLSGIRIHTGGTQVQMAVFFATW